MFMFSFVNLVPTILFTVLEGGMTDEDNAWELTKSCSDHCLYPGTVPENHPWRQCLGTDKKLSWE